MSSLKGPDYVEDTGGLFPSEKIGHMEQIQDVKGRPLPVGEAAWVLCFQWNVKPDLMAQGLPLLRDAAPMVPHLPGLLPGMGPGRPASSTVIVKLPLSPESGSGQRSFPFWLRPAEALLGPLEKLPIRAEPVT